MKTTEDAANDLHVDLSVTDNDIQALQDEDNYRETYLREAREELEEYGAAMEELKTQLNEERGQAGERRQKRETV